MLIPAADKNIAIDREPTEAAPGPPGSQPGACQLSVTDPAGSVTLYSKHNRQKL